MQALALSETAQTPEDGLAQYSDAYLGGDVRLSIAQLLIT
jgi:hypothetical protein